MIGNVTPGAYCFSCRQVRGLCTVYC